MEERLSVEAQNVRQETFNDDARSLRRLRYICAGGVELRPKGWTATSRRAVTSRVRRIAHAFRKARVAPEPCVFSGGACGRLGIRDASSVQTSCEAFS